MFVLLRYVTRSFVLGVAVGVLFAPRPGAETRKMLSERISSAINQILEIAALPPIQPERARTNGHAGSSTPKKTTRASMDARASS